MNKEINYRDNGAIGALLDEYEKAINELNKVTLDVTEEELVHLVDLKTTDEDCRSIQSILSHVVESGYNYAVIIRKWLGEEIEYKRKKKLNTIEDYQNALDQMFIFNEELFRDYPKIQLEEFDPSAKIRVRWGQRYDVDQLLEHAIVHILRHRRQIERFKIRLRENKT